MPPFLGGGEMILRRHASTASSPPTSRASSRPARPRSPRSSASAPPSTTSTRLGMDAVRRHEVELTAYALRTLTERFGDDLTIHGPAEPAERGGVLSFAFGDLHPHDLSQVLDQHGVCVRPGHHCAKPLMRVLGVGATARASLYVYNDSRRHRRPRPTRSRPPATSSRSDHVPTTAATSHADHTRSHRMSGLEDLYREIILDHYRSPRNRGELDVAPGAPGRGLQPAVRRRDRRLPRRRRPPRAMRRRDRHPHRRPGLLDPPVVGLDDVGRGEGQDRRRGPRPHPGVQGHDVDPRGAARGRRGRGRPDRRPRA